MRHRPSKSILIFTTSLLFLALASCISNDELRLTDKLWNKKYEEILQQFLVTKNGSQVVLIGRKYHYIFDDNSKLIANLLLWNSRNILFIDLKETYLKVDNNDIVTGYATIKSDKKLSPEDASFLFAHGFKEVSYGVLAIRFNLYGHRYLPPEGSVFYTYSLSRQYNLEVHVKLNPDEKAKATALTPLTMAADGAIWFGKNVLLAPFKW